MWTWSFNAYGPRTAVLNDITAATLSTELVDGAGVVVPIPRVPGETVQFNAAKTAALTQINASLSGAGLAVSCSGNSTVYSLSVKQIGDPSSNVADLVVALHNAQAQGGLERDVTALLSLKKLTTDTETALAAKGKP